MKDIPQLYILGLPIETELGECNFLKIKDLPDYMGDLQFISWSKEQIIYELQIAYKGVEMDELTKELQNTSLFKIVTSLDFLRNAYKRVLDKSFNKPIFPLLNEDSFNLVRNLIIKMNCQAEEVINPNPEIQKAIERSKRVKSAERGTLTFEDIITSVQTYTGQPYEIINEYTLYQLYATFHRIGAFKNYDTSTLFATVSSEKIKIDNWSVHIDLFKEDNHAMTEEQFGKTVKKAVQD